MLGAVASVPPGCKLGAPLVVERPWLPSVVHQLACRLSDFVARLPLSVGVLGSLGLPVAPDFLVVVPTPVLVAASWLEMFHWQKILQRERLNNGFF